MSISSTIVGQQLRDDAENIPFERVTGEVFRNKLNTFITEDSKGFIWLGSQMGLYRYDGYDWVAITFQASDSDQSSTGVVELSNGEIWRSSHINGIDKISPILETQYPVRPGDTTGFQTHNVNTTRLKKWGNQLFIGTRRGFFFYNINKNRLSEPYIPYPEKGILSPISNSTDNYIPNNIRDAISMDYDSTKLWLATANEFGTYDLKEEIFKPIDIPGKEPQTGRKYDPIQLAKAGQKIVIATWGGGIRIYDPLLKTWESILVEDPSNGPDFWKFNVIHEIQQVSDQFFLYACHTHIGFVDLATKKIIPFNISSVNSPEGYEDIIIDKHGRIYATCQEGVIRSIYPIFNLDDKDKDFLQLTDATINGKKVYDEILKLGSKDTMSVTVALVNSIDKVDYAYRLLGLENEWKPLEEERSIQLNNLKRGTFPLEVKATTEKREVIKQLCLISFQEAFIESRLFKEMLAAVLLCVVLFGYLWYSRRKNEREKLKKEQENTLLKLEMQALRAQMNPHFIFNSLNSIKNFIVNKGTEEAADYLTKFSNLIRIILENSKHEKVSLAQELDALKLYVDLEKLRFKNQFTVTYQINADVLLDHFFLPPMLIQPYVENAIWHGLLHKQGDKVLKIIVDKYMDGILIIIEDNGIGREASRSINKGKSAFKSSMGNMITESRLKNMNKVFNASMKVEIMDLKTPEDSPQGTLVKLYFNHMKSYRT